MKLTKKLLAVLLSLLMVFAMAVPALAEDAETPAPPTAEEIQAARNNLQAAVNRKINYDAYASGTDTFDAALPAAQAILDNAEATYDELVKGLADLNAAKSDLVLKDGIAGAFSANNQAASMNIEGNGVIQMDWTMADVAPIDLSKSDLSKVYIAFDLTLTSANPEVPVADAFRTGNLVLRSVRTDVENKLEYSVATHLLPLQEGKNELKICVAGDAKRGGKMDWSKVEALRLFFDSTNGKTGPFTMKMENIRIIDETPADYKPIEGEVAAFRDPTVYQNVGGDNKTLPGEWVTTTTPADLSGKNLSKAFLVVKFFLTNETGLTDEEIFHIGYFRLRSPDTASEADPVGENNVGYSIADLMDKEIIGQLKSGENTVKIPLDAKNDAKGTMDWANVNRFRMYFDALPTGLEAGKLTLQVEYAKIVDENEELAEGVLGVFEDETTYVPTETAAKVVETPWINAGVDIDVTPGFDNTYLHVNLTLDGEDAIPENLTTGYFRLRSPDTTPTEDNLLGENNIGYAVKNLVETGVIEALKAGDNDLWIPLSASNDDKGTIDWTAVNRFRVYLNLPEEGLDVSLKLNTVELVDNTANVDLNELATFSQAEGTYTAEAEKPLQTAWPAADKAANLSEANLDNTYLIFKLALTNETGAADADVFKTGKILLASSNTPSEADTVGENSVSASIAKLVEDEVIAALTTGEQTIAVPLSAFETEKGTIDWADITKFRFFIDSTDKQTGKTSMTLSDVMIYNGLPGEDDDDNNNDELKIGDANKDGAINVTDALAVLQHVTGKVFITDETALILADTNSDSTISVDDALKILQFITGKIESFA